jgi:hypothetical protein
MAVPSRRLPKWHTLDICITICYNYRMLANNNKLLVLIFSDMLREVPQDKIHHPEGNVLNHTRLVRKNVNKAILMLKDLQQINNILSNLSFEFSREELQIIFMCAYLHDIGKVSATNVESDGRITSVGHQDIEHFVPQINNLRRVCPKSIEDFYYSHVDVISFVIEHHMDFALGGFPKRLIRNMFDNGVIKGELKYAILLVIMWADKLGRGIVPDFTKNINLLKSASKYSINRQKRIDNGNGKAFTGTVDEFMELLYSRGLNDSDVMRAVQNKFPCHNA